MNVLWWPPFGGPEPISHVYFHRLIEAGIIEPVDVEQATREHRLGNYLTLHPEMSFYTPAAPFDVTDYRSALRVIDCQNADAKHERLLAALAPRSEDT
jgi:hypothetical protein